MKVWVLLLYVSGMGGDNLTTVDNIASQVACLNMGQAVIDARIHPEMRFRCIEVEKAAP